MVACKALLRAHNKLWYDEYMNIVLILLAGKGERFDLETPKQFKEIGDKQLFLYSFETFLKHPMIDRIILVSDDTHIDYVKTLIQERYNENIEVISGGETRQLSVYQGLTYLKENSVKDSDNILVHDAARPLVSEKVISRCLEALKEHHAIVPTIPVSDTAVKISKDYIESVINRDSILLNQTPQCFRFDLIFKAHQEAQKLKMYDKTDDVSLVLNIGEKVHFVPGDKFNIKVTTIEDFLLVDHIIKSR